MANYISKNSLKRIPFYMGFLKNKKEEGEEFISSTTIAKGLGLNDVQVRKDLASVSHKGGKPKIGYNIDELISDIELSLGYCNENLSILVGTGNLGSALLGYKNFTQYGMKIIAAFDADSNKVGKSDHDIVIQSIDQIKEFCATHEVDIGIITVPSPAAQIVCDLLIEAGVKAIWNFAPTRLNIPDDIVIQNENMASSLAVLSRRLNEKKYIK